MIQGSTAATVEQQRNSTDNSSDVQCTASEVRRISPLAILMEEMEQMPLRGPEGTTTEITIDTIENGDWLVVVYDEHWWLVKDIAVTLSIKISKWSSCTPMVLQSIFIQNLAGRMFASDQLQIFL
ncbi:hypothetical protein AAFF_G00367480 [Aldrovandia affinis]|uniref:Uncharacterized protein n=1 Tax=Aldrovandia affinis TaxID=143900 RepID=A0AAD7SHI6_9TELE|nr:hypothetical protein AAFF_G00367480 [Aldrovandia affinis]